MSLMRSSTEKVDAPAVVKRPRSTRRTVLVGAGAFGLFAIAVLVGRLSPKPLTPPPDSVGTRLDTVVPDSIRHLPLTDENGRTTNLAAFDGKVVVFADFMTLCQEICPITTSELNQMDSTVTKAGLAGKVQFVNLTIDPDRDTPDRLRAYRSFAQLLPNWSLLTGTPANLATLWKYFGATYSKTPADSPPPLDWLTGKPLTYDIVHSDVLVFFDAQGHERYELDGMPNGTTAPLTSGERGFLSAEGRANLADTADATWTEPQGLQVVSWLTKKHLHAPK
jgi:protein SCO1/2